MQVNTDFRDLFAALNAAGARYLLVGGYAVAFHAQPRYTKDLDVWVEPSPENAARVHAALQAFGAPLAGVSERDFTRPEVVYQMGLPPNRIDVLTAIDGVSWPDAWAGRATTVYGGESVPVIGRVELVRAKRAAGRPQDLIDADLLERSGGD